MSAARYKILSFGYDLALLSKRERELREAGFDVDSVSAFEEAATLARRNRYDLAIVGHAVGEAERNRLAKLLKAGDGAVPIIFLYRDSIRNAAQADALLSVLADPGDLVAAARNLIGRTASAGADT